MTIKISQWSEIRDEYNGTLILGNGASIAVDERFAYGSLKGHAAKNGLLTEDVQSIFNFFHTDDFELALRIVWQATNVNASLAIDDAKTQAAYKHIRSSLIETVRHIHPTHDEVSAQMPHICNFLRRFQTIISLNYDLIVYWATMHGLDGNGHVFKDCFVNSEFDENWRRFREPIRGEMACSLVFYPHGNIALARDKIEQEHKIASRDRSLRDQILAAWESGSYVPLFVSEGTSKQKKKSISSSHYLSTVYREVLVSLPSNIVIYGWGLGEHDLHILQRMAQSGVQRMAVSVFNNDQVYCNRIKQAVLDICKINVTFFDSQSDACWNRA